nr:MAG TPA: hypothetical protein [Caudoviricetes sp.]
MEALREVLLQRIHFLLSRYCISVVIHYIFYHNQVFLSLTFTAVLRDTSLINNINYANIVNSFEEREQFAIKMRFIRYLE